VHRSSRRSIRWQRQSWAWDKRDEDTTVEKAKECTIKLYRWRTAYVLYEISRNLFALLPCFLPKGRQY
jgi:hypothetical protein